MTTEQWKGLTPAHRAELWPGLSDHDRSAILAADPDALRSIAAITAEELVARDRVITAPRPPQERPKGMPISAALCYILTALSLLGAFGFAFQTSYIWAVACAAGAALWWAIGDIATRASRTK